MTFTQEYERMRPLDEDEHEDARVFTVRRPRVLDAQRWFINNYLDYQESLPLRSIYLDLPKPVPAKPKRKYKPRKPKPVPWNEPIEGPATDLFYILFDYDESYYKYGVEPILAKALKVAIKQQWAVVAASYQRGNPIPLKFTM